MSNRWRYRDILVALAILLILVWSLTGQSQVSVNPLPPPLQLTPAGGPAGPPGGTGASGATGTLGNLVQKSSNYAVTCADFANYVAFQATGAITFTLPTGCTTGWATFVPAASDCPVAFNLSTNTVTANGQSTLSSLTVCTGTAGYPGYILTPDSTTDFSVRNTGPQGAAGASGPTGPVGATGSGGGGGGNGSAAVTGTTSIVGSTSTTFTYSSVLKDTCSSACANLGAHNDRLTVPATGWWDCTFNALAPAGYGAWATMVPLANGAIDPFAAPNAEVFTLSVTPTAALGFVFSWKTYRTAGDYIGFQVGFAGGSTANFQANLACGWFGS